METSTLANSHSSNRINPKKFSLILLIISMTMLFMAFTSGFIVRRAEGNWNDFTLPIQFFYSVVVVILSSITMWYANKSAKLDKTKSVQWSLALTLILGLGFVTLQVLAWLDMAERGIFLVPANHGESGGISGSFIITIAWMHLLHIIGGIIFVLVVLIKALKLKVNKSKLLNINMCSIYWHFVGILWIYLYLFFYFAPQF